MQAHEQHVVAADRDIDKMRGDLATVQAAWGAAGGRSPGVEVRGTRLAGEGYRKPAGQALAAILQRVQVAAVRSRDAEIIESAGRYAGLELRAGGVREMKERTAIYHPQLWARGRQVYAVNGSVEKPETLVASLEALLHPSRIQERIARATQQREAHLRRILELRRELAKPFEHGPALDQLRERRDALVSELQLRDDGEVLLPTPQAASAGLPGPEHVPAARRER